MEHIVKMFDSNEIVSNNDTLIVIVCWTSLSVSSYCCCWCCCITTVTERQHEWMRVTFCICQTINVLGCSFCLSVHMYILINTSNSCCFNFSAFVHAARWCINGSERYRISCKMPKQVSTECLYHISKLFTIYLFSRETSVREQTLLSLRVKICY